MRADNKCSKCCPSALMHALSCFLQLLVAASITFCCNNFNEALLQLIDTLYTTFIYFLLHTTPDLIIHWIQVWAVWWPEIRTNEVQHFLL